MPDLSTPTHTSAGPWPDRDATIEQLLLAGLDQYFAGRFEQAIHLWTRILFLDRGHARARAYIERARQAVAERQRALEEQQSHDDLSRSQEGVRRQALPALPRVEAGARSSIDPPPALDPSAPSTRRGATPEPVWPYGILTAVSLLLLCAAGYIVSHGEAASRWMLASPAQGTSGTPDANPMPPPGSEGSRVVVDRARGLFARGQLREALELLEDIPLDDAARPEADELRAELERALVDSGGLSSAVTRAPTSQR